MRIIRQEKEFVITASEHATTTPPAGHRPTAS
jgi:hypothetical protein